jgi:adenylate cyclase
MKYIREFTSIIVLVIIATIPGFPQKYTKPDSLKKILAANNKNDTKTVQDLLNLANAFRDISEDSSIKYARKALSLSEFLNYKPGVIRSLLNMGITYSIYQHYMDSANYYIAIAKDAAADTKDFEMVARCWNMMGRNMEMFNNYKAASRYLDSAQAIFQNIRDTIGLVSVLSRKGEILSDQGTDNRYKAYKLFQQALAFSRQCRIPDDTLEGLYIALGEFYFQLGEYDTARHFYFMAKPLAEKLKKPGFISYLYTCMAQIFLTEKKYDSAFYYAMKGLKISQDFSMLKEIMDNLLLLCQIYKAKDNFKEALHFYEQYVTLNDSVRNASVEQSVTRINFELQTVKNREKINLQNHELNRQKLIRNGFIGGFIIVLLFAGIFFSQRNKISKEKKRSEQLLLNILPAEVADELKAKGSAEAKHFDRVTVMFTDFKGFTKMSEKLSPAQLVAEIDICFKAFDQIISNYNIEKIKTIGDSYMCAGGLPTPNSTNAADVVSAATEIQQFMQQHLQQRVNEGKESFEIRIGVHTGPVVAGIVGVKKFAYDIWGDTVNIASRMESSGEAGKVNISGDTFQLVKDKFICIYRGKIEAKYKGEIDMYFVEDFKKKGTT